MTSRSLSRLIPLAIPTVRHNAIPCGSRNLSKNCPYSCVEKSAGTQNSKAVGDVGHSRSLVPQTVFRATFATPWISEENKTEYAGRNKTFIHNGDNLKVSSVSVADYKSVGRSTAMFGIPKTSGGGNGTEDVLNQGKNVQSRKGGVSGVEPRKKWSGASKPRKKPRKKRKKQDGRGSTGGGKREKGFKYWFISFPCQVLSRFASIAYTLCRNMLKWALYSYIECNIKIKTDMYRDDGSYMLHGLRPGGAVILINMPQNMKSCFAYCQEVYLQFTEGRSTDTPLAIGLSIIIEFGAGVDLNIIWLYNNKQLEASFMSLLYDKNGISSLHLVGSRYDEVAAHLEEMRSKYPGEGVSKVSVSHYCFDKWFVIRKILSEEKK